MITPTILDELLAVCRKHNLMTIHLESGGDKLAATLGPDMGPPDSSSDDGTPRMPGGWKTEVSDPQDPDPLGLGPLDAPIEVIE